MNVADAVARAWAETLPDAPPDVAWDEAGGDSLGLLHLAYRLEQLLGRELSMELLRIDITQSGLVAAIAGGDPAPSVPGGLTVFLLPGLYGGAGMTEFREALADRFDFRLVEPPPIEQPARLFADMAAAGAHAAAAIADEAPAGPLILAGYSFGGSVALEAAAVLRASGREVALVAVLDSAIGGAMWGSGVRARWDGLVGEVKTTLAASDPLRRLLVALADRAVPGRRALGLRRAFTRLLKTRARRSWRPTPLDVPVWIALSDEFAPRTAAAWRHHYPHATTVRVPGTHQSLIRAEGLPELTRAFAAAVATAAG